MHKHSKNCTSRESVSPLSRLIRGFRNKINENRTPEPPVPEPQLVYSSIRDVCNMCVPTYSSRSGAKEKEKQNGEDSFSKTKQKRQRDLNSLFRGLQD